MSKKSKKNKARGANTSGSSADTSKESVEDEISLHASDRTLEDRQALHAILPPNWDQLGDLEREFFLQKHRALPVAWKNMDLEQKQNFYRRMGLNMDLSVREDEDPDTVNKPNTFEETKKARNAAAKAEADLKEKALKRRRLLGNQKSDPWLAGGHPAWHHRVARLGQYLMSYFLLRRSSPNWGPHTQGTTP